VLGTHDSSRIKSGTGFKAGAHHRSFGTKQRHRLTLHVGTHQRTVGIIMFKEWNKACSNGYNLLWCHIHQMNAFYGIIINGNTHVR
jgi:hypothetical protein